MSLSSIEILFFTSISSSINNKSSRSSLSELSPIRQPKPPTSAPRVTNLEAENEAVPTVTPDTQRLEDEEDGFARVACQR
jgi:hypothetical protein